MYSLGFKMGVGSAFGMELGLAGHDDDLTLFFTVSCGTGVGLSGGLSLGFHKTPTRSSCKSGPWQSSISTVVGGLSKQGKAWEVSYGPGVGVFETRSNTWTIRIPKPNANDVDLCIRFGIC